MIERLQAKKFQFIQFILMNLIGITIACICFYPGTLSNDSQWQLAQADSNQYSDMHPPVMSAIWHGLNLIFPLTHGSANLFIYFNFLYFLSVSTIAFVNHNHTLRRWIFFSLIICSLPALLILGAIVKDTLMTVNLLFVYALMTYAANRKVVLPLLLALPALFIAFCARYNAIFAIFPFCVWFVFIIFEILNFHPKKFLMPILLFIILSVITGSLFAGRIFFDRFLLAATQTYNSQSVLTFDLVGVSVRSGENCLPPFYDKFSKPLSLDLLQFIYRPYSNYYIFWPATPGDPVLPFVNTKAQSDELLHYWIKALKNHPKEMLQHKFDAYISMLGMMHKYSQLKANELYSPIGIKWAKLVTNRIMDGWIYLTLLTLTLPFFFKLSSPHRVLFCSSYFYALSWMLCTPNTEQRYFSWVIVGCTVLFANLVVNYIKHFQHP